MRLVQRASVFIDWFIFIHIYLCWCNPMKFVWRDHRSLTTLQSILQNHPNASSMRIFFNDNNLSRKLIIIKYFFFILLISLYSIFVHSVHKGNRKNKNTQVKLKNSYSFVKFLIKIIVKYLIFVCKILRIT